MSSTTIACPTFAEDPNRGTYYSAVGWTLQGVAMLAVAIRLYSRIWVTRSAGSDDVTIVIGTIICLVGQVGDELAVRSGLGRHCSFLTRSAFEDALKWLYIDWIIAFVAFFFLRLSVMLFTLRLLPRTKFRSQIIIYVAMFLNFAISLIAAVSYGLHCQPVSAYWHPVQGAKCLNSKLLKDMMIVNGVLASVIDIVTALIPAFLLWRVQMKRSTKIVLDVIFLLGFVTAALSVGRAATTDESTWSTDITYRLLPPNTFSIVESKLGILLASCPAIRQLHSYYKRTRTILPTSSRQAPNSDFAEMRHRVNLRDWIWRGKRDETRREGLVRYAENSVGNSAASGSDPEDSPLSAVEGRLVRGLERV